MDTQSNINVKNSASSNIIATMDFYLMIDLIIEISIISEPTILQDFTNKDFYVRF